MRAGPSSGPRVALVHDWLNGIRGGEHVLAELAALFPGAPIFTLFHRPEALEGVFDGHEIIASGLDSIPGAHRFYRWLLPLYPAAIEALPVADFDLVISSSHCAAKGVIPGPDARHLCYCHTPMRYAWDQERVYFPARRGPLAWWRRLAISRLRTWDVTASHRVDRFVANSRFVARRIERYYRREADVVHPPVDVDFFHANEERSASRSDFALVVNALVPYKRVDLAIEACRRARRPLVIVGQGPDRRRLEALAQGSETRFLGRVDRTTLRDVYGQAALFLQPGLEDFGIASVEALASGLPVVALGRGGIEDVVEDGRHGVLTPEATAEALADAIDRTADFRFNPKDLRARARNFSRERFRERMQRALGLASTPSSEGNPP